MAQRVPNIERDDLDAAGQEVFDHIAGSRGSVRGPFAVLLHNPQVALRVADVGEQLRYHGVLPGSLRELGILEVGRKLEAPVEWAAHHPLAVKEGTSQEAIDAVFNQSSTAGLKDAREKLVIDTGRALMANGRLSESEFRAVEAEFGRDGAIELIVLTGYYQTLAYVLNSTDVPAGDGSNPFGK